MTDNMVERVARTLCAQRGQEPDEVVRWLIPGTDYEEGEPYPLWTEWLPAARAAIEAMREPTEAMVEAGIPELDGGAAWAWYAMIDAALEED